MNKYSRVFTYLKEYKTSIVLYFITILLSIVFSVLSIGMLLPFMQLIFDVKQSGLPKTAISGNAITRFLNQQLDHLINNGDKLHALVWFVC